jgi:zinc transporter, ZIP family
VTPPDSQFTDASGVDVRSSLAVPSQPTDTNIPQALAPSADLAAAGWGVGRLARLWSGVVLACGVAAALGFVLADVNSGFEGQAMAAIAAGGLLAMLTNSLRPFAYDRGGDLAGLATVIGFCLALIGS